MYDVDHKSEPRQSIEHEIPKDDKKKNQKKSSVLRRSCELVDKMAATTCLESPTVKSIEVESTGANEETKEQEDDSPDSQLRELEACSTSRDRALLVRDRRSEASKKTLGTKKGDADQNEEYVDGTLMMIRASEESQETQEGNQWNSETSSSLTGQASLGFAVDTKVKTIATTMPRTTCHDLRCYESIVVNEETLNKIVVPTAVSTEPLCQKRFVARNRYACPDTSDGKSRCSQTDGQRKSYENDQQHSSSLNRDTDAKARRRTSIEVSSFSLPSRNVFVKTKRMIFSPFRRGEDRLCDPVTKRDDKTRKSKSKSRSASPKGPRRGDAPSCRTVLLPWSHLGATFGSKEPKSGDSWDEMRDWKDGKRGKGEERERGNERKVEIEEARDRPGGLDRFGNARARSPLEKMGTRRANAQTVAEFRSIKRLGLDDCDLPVEADRRAAVSDPSEGPFPVYETLGAETTDECHGELGRKSNNPTLPSDLVHKLRILSNVAARKDGRLDNKTDARVDSSTSPSSSMDVRSSRLRRTREAFLFNKSDPTAFDSTTTMSLGSNNDASRRSRRANANYDEITTTGSPSAGTDCRLKTRSTTETMAISSDSDAIDSSKSDLVKSASAGMINVDPDTSKQLTATSERGYESLPRTISKRYDFGIGGPLARIANKLKLSRLMRGRDFSTNEGSLRTITTLCRQSLLIEVGRCNDQQEERHCVEGSRQDAEKFRETHDNDP